jgi:ADP-ribose pyrophosphatase YjhB (NUDIX family)
MEDGGAPLPATYFRPRESERGIYTEKKIGDDWRALWSTDALPEGAKVTRVTMIPYRGERAVVGWTNGTGRLPEGDVREGEDLVDAMKRIALEQAGIAHAHSKHLGHFTYTAPSLNKEVPAGTTAYHALYVLEVTELADAPTDDTYERRIVLQRDLNQILRTTQVENRREFADALDVWLLERLKSQSTGRN